MLDFFHNTIEENVPNVCIPLTLLCISIATNSSENGYFIIHMENVTIFPIPVFHFLLSKKKKKVLIDLKSCIFSKFNQIFIVFN